MRPTLLMIIGFLLLFTSMALVQSTHAQSTDDHASDRAYIKQAESDWAESSVSNDVSVLERILADDFVGVHIDGSHYSKAGAIKDSRARPSEFVFNHLNEIEIRFYGDEEERNSWKVRLDRYLDQARWQMAGRSRRRSRAYRCPNCAALDPDRFRQTHIRSRLESSV